MVQAKVTVHPTGKKTPLLLGYNFYLLFPFHISMTCLFPCPSSSFLSLDKKARMIELVRWRGLWNQGRKYFPSLCPLCPYYISSNQLWMTSLFLTSGYSSFPFPHSSLLCPWTSSHGTQYSQVVLHHTFPYILFLGSFLGKPFYPCLDQLYFLNALS